MTSGKTFLGLSTILSLSAPSYEFRAPASQLPWCWLLVVSSPGIVLGLRSTWLVRAPGTRGPPSLHPQEHSGQNIFLCTGTPLFSLTLTYLPSGANFFNDESTGSIYLSVALFQSWACLTNPSDATWGSVCYRIPSLDVSSVSVLSGAQKVLNKIC